MAVYATDISGGGSSSAGVSLPLPDAGTGASVVAVDTVVGVVAAVAFAVADAVADSTILSPPLVPVVAGAGATVVAIVAPLALLLPPLATVQAPVEVSHSIGTLPGEWGARPLGRL
jgi:hypothetical protein